MSVESLNVDWIVALDPKDLYATSGIDLASC